MEIKLIASDLDGTLLRADKTISDYTLDTLDRAAARGIAFVPATGRIFPGLPRFLRDLPFLRYAILMNGALVYDCVEDKALRRASIPPEEADRLFARLQELPVTLDCYMGDSEGYMEAEDYEHFADWVSDPIIRRNILGVRKPMPHLHAYVRARGEGVQKVQVFFRDEALRREMMARLAEEFPGLSVACALPGNVEFTHQDATKGAALRFLCAHLGVPLEQAMAFGDERNDLTMLSAAGVGVAMGNASPEAKAAASLVTESNEDDGVARAIRRLVLEME